MNQDVLKNSVATLNKLRDVYHSQLDAGALAELDEVLQQLTKLAESKKKDVPLGELTLRVFRIIDNTLSLVTNLTDLMR
jgi:hypothetical protein